LNYPFPNAGEWVSSVILTEGWTRDKFNETNSCLVLVIWDEALESNIQGF